KNPFFGRRVVKDSLCRLGQVEVGLVKLPVNNASPVWCHSPPVAGGHVQAVIEAPETLPPLGDVPRRHATNHMDVSVPHVEVLTSEDIPISVQQRSAPLLIKTLQALDVERVVFHQVWVVLSLSWNEGILHAKLIFPHRIGRSL